VKRSGFTVQQNAIARNEVRRRLAVNAINVIAPYKHHGMWVFDDPRVGLVQEPFVAGADTMIDRVVADIPDAEHGFTLIFSTTPFPGHEYRLQKTRKAGSGNGAGARWNAHFLRRDTLWSVLIWSSHLGIVWASGKHTGESMRRSQGREMALKTARGCLLF
jgi:hypothetical protein